MCVCAWGGGGGGGGVEGEREGVNYEEGRGNPLRLAIQLNWMGAVDFHFYSDKIVGQ